MPHFVLIPLGIVFLTATLVESLSNNAHIKWFLCKTNVIENTVDKNFSISLLLLQNSNKCITIKRFGTVLSSLQTNRGNNLAAIYYNRNLENIPDIAHVGKLYYTYWYIGIFTLSNYQLNNVNDGRTSTFINFHGINYRPEFYFNGVQVFDTTYKSNSGMFRRYAIDITPFLHTSTNNNNNTVSKNSPYNLNEERTINHSSTTARNHKDHNQHTIAVLVYPPDSPGAVSPGTGGQGGDHEIARNGAVIQCTAGWDWIQATPDRNTGIFDKVTIEQSGWVRIINPYITTESIDVHHREALLTIEATIVNNYKYSHTLNDNNSNNNISGTKENDDDSKPLIMTLRVSIVDNNNNEVMQLSSTKLLSPGEKQAIEFQHVVVSKVRLWWPHTHGIPYLYTVHFSVFIHTEADIHNGMDNNNNNNNNKPTDNITSATNSQSSPGSTLTRSHSLSLRYGIRTIQGYIHPATQGWAFKVNDVPIFLLGGNWIATDQLLRHSNGDAISIQRYKQEVVLHRSAGLNLIRVWGGGIAERSDFYTACDELGMLVHQDFWMTGDNNGRWAGSYDWPDDKIAYLDNIHDTILTLRSHPSLMLWCGGNELHPREKSPPPFIAAGIQELLLKLDPRRFYLPSTMSPQNNNPREYDAYYALAAADGPYGLLYTSRWYNERNPGLVGYNNTPISYQPEVGSVSMPVIRSLKRFLPPASLTNEAVPKYLAKVDEVDVNWQYYKYLPFVTDGKYDHIYAYGNQTHGTTHDSKHPNKSISSIDKSTSPSFFSNLTLEEYNYRAQLVQYKQYQALFEGYLLHQFQYYAAVLFWKSQSPWPSMRGALYDYYLDYTGGFMGVQVATRVVRQYQHPCFDKNSHYRNNKNSNKNDDDDDDSNNQGSDSNNQGSDSNNQGSDSNNQGSDSNNQGSDSNNHASRYTRNNIDDDIECVDEIGMKTGAALHVIFNPKTRILSVVNRSPTAATGVSLTVQCMSLHGVIMYEKVVVIKNIDGLNIIPGNSVVSYKQAMKWPSSTDSTNANNEYDNDEVYLYFFSINYDDDKSNDNDNKRNNNAGFDFVNASLSNMYWLSHPKYGDASNFTELGQLRQKCQSSPSATSSAFTECVQLITRVVQPLTLINYSDYYNYYNRNSGEVDDEIHNKNSPPPSAAITSLHHLLHTIHPSDRSTALLPIQLAAYTKMDNSDKYTTINSNDNDGLRNKGKGCDDCCDASSSVTMYAVVEVECPSTSPQVAFVLKFTLLRGTNDSNNNANNNDNNGSFNNTSYNNSTSNEERRVLPTFYSSNYITLRPNEKVILIIAASISIDTLYVMGKDSVSNDDGDDYNINKGSNNNKNNDDNSKYLDKNNSKCNSSCYDSLLLCDDDCCYKSNDFHLEIEGWNIQTQYVQL